MTGPVLLITGGSRGIGAAAATLAAARGYAVCVNYRSNAGAANTVVTSIVSGGGRAIAVQADVAIESDVVRLFEACDRDLGSLSALVNNAGIRVNAVRPGVIYTDIHASGGEPGRVDRVKASVPMRRGGTADEVANAILWLLSSEASYVTGSILDVTGGR